MITRSSISRFGAVTIGLALAVRAILGTPAMAENNCEWYARTALRQQQDNDQRKCGFDGPAWSWDFKAHVTWCATANPDQWKAEAQQRERQLATCKTTQ
jgi:hypothetical protein